MDITWQDIAKIITIYELEVSNGSIPKYSDNGAEEMETASKLILEKYRLFAPDTKDSIKTPDVWEARRYELVKEQVINKGATISYAITIADEMISKLKALTI